MKLKSIIISFLLAIFIATNIGTVYAAEEAPYRGYTYDEWGNATPAPNGYLPEMLVTGEEVGTANFKEPMDLFVDKVNNELYVADTGNNRIVVLDSNFKMIKVIDGFLGEGVKETFKAPTGVFVHKNGEIYVADKGNARILVGNRDGEFVKKFGAPVSEIIPEDFVYQPEKVVVDKHGRIYVQAFGVFQGMICLDTDGRFINYFGSNRVDVTAKLLLEMAWKKILSKEAARAMMAAVPIEYSNMFIDNDDFIYATVRASSNSQGELKKLNPLGINILRTGSNYSYVKPNRDYGDFPVVWVNGTKRDSTFVDISVDDDSFISALDSTRGKVFQYDAESNLMFVIGGMGDQVGNFRSPVSVENFNGKILVLDSYKNNITVFGITSFGESVKLATKLYNDGFYKEDLEPWKEVLKRDSNYLLAYVGMGKAYYQLEDYVSAMKYYKLGNDKKGYSDAFKEYSTELMRENFGSIFFGLMLLFISTKLIKNRKKISSFVRKKRGGIVG